jgi:hypothetical protein
VKGYHVKPDGSTDVALGYSRSMVSVALVEGFEAAIRSDRQIITDTQNYQRSQA